MDSNFPVVRIFANTQEPDYDCPWQTHAPESSSGSGVVVDPGRILTGAHVVANATFLQVQKLGNPDKAVARVRSICHDADLALLETDPAFTEGLAQVPVGDLPDFKDRVSVVGFPIGGEEVSVTEGVVSRVEVQTYDHSQRRLLAITIDAAINSGNSGGPVFDDTGRICGIAFQKLGDADGIGEMVPGTLIEQFLHQAEAARVVEVPDLGIRDQALESPSLRRFLGLGDDLSGVLVRHVVWGSSAWGVIEPGDVLLGIDGYAIANNGTTRYHDRYRTQYRVFLGDRAIGDEVPVKLLRQGKILERTLTLKPASFLVPRARYDVEPSWMVWGGLVFQRLTRDFLATWEDWDNRAPTGLVVHYESGLPTAERPEIVLLSRVLADELTMGMDLAECEVVERVGDERVQSMAHLARLLDHAKGDVEIQTASGVRLVLEAGEVARAQPRILERYHVPRDRSRDLARPAASAAAEAAKPT